MPRASAKAPTQQQLATPGWVEDVGSSIDWLNNTLEDETEYTNALFWGEEGTGKTTALCGMVNLPGPGKVIIISKEGGLKKAPLRRMGIDPEQIIPWPPKDSGIEVSYHTMEKLQLQIKRQLEKDPGSIKGVGWDSVTEIAQDLVLQAVQRALDKYERTGKGRGEDSDEFDIEQSDWGIMSSQVKTLLRRYRDLPCHFGVTALTREPDGKKEVARGPAVNPGLATGLLGYVDFSLMLESESPRTADGLVTLVTARTKKSPRLRCKDRDGVLPDPFPEPSFDRLHAYASGKLTEENDPGFAAHAAVRQAAADLRAKRAEATNSTTTKKEK